MFPRKKIKDFKQNNIDYFPIDWVECDIYSKTNNTDDKYKYKYLRKHGKTYSIFSFGVCNKEENTESYSTCIQINNYNPYFYVQIPNQWTDNEIKEFETKFLKADYLIDKYILDEYFHQYDSKTKKTKIINDDYYPIENEEKMHFPYYKTGLIKYEIVEKEIFWTFTNHKKFKFWKLIFSSLEAHKLYYDYLIKYNYYHIHKHKPKYKKYNKYSNDINSDSADDDDDAEDTEDAKNTTDIINGKKSEGKETGENGESGENGEDGEDIDLGDDIKEETIRDKILKHVNYGIRYKFKLYEASLSPLLRFYHDTKIAPTDWIYIKNIQKTDKISHCQLEFSIDWTTISASQLASKYIPQILICSFDIEADSSHGEFPLASKTFKKLANELVICYLRDIASIEKGQTELKSKINTAKYFSSRIKQSLDKQYETIDKDISITYVKAEYRRKISAFCRSDELDTIAEEIFAICKGRTISKVKANKLMKKATTEIERREAANWNKHICSFADLQTLIKLVAAKYEIDYIQLESKYITKDIIVKYICGILNYGINKYLGIRNQNLTAVEGDAIIQIGSAFWFYGNDKPAHYNILTLGTCDKFNVAGENVEIVECKSEKELLMKWVDMLREYDPDIMMGYNIFGFDEEYIYTRMIDLMPNIAKSINKNGYIMESADEEWNNFINMGKLRGETCKYIQSCRGKLMMKKLASSALGDNYLYYFNMVGRVQIDLLKCIQADPTMKLPSYKLDSVADKFIGGGVCSVVDATTLIVECINEIEIGNYIVISMQTGEQFANGEKIQVCDIKDVHYRKKIQCGTIKINREISDVKVFMDGKPTWGLAKDDITPQDIFRMQKEGPTERALIAKYCIQDCVLVLRLLRKIQTIPKNIGMSNVCLVPFVFIFMRGQGIKIYSLITNECAQSGMLLPELERIDLREADADADAEAAPITKLGKHRAQNDADDEEDDDAEDADADADAELADNFNVVYIDGSGYEGATVLKPKTGIYTEDPITVLDFGSLYPSEIIASNISHDTHCEHPKWLGDGGAARIRAIGYDFIDRVYDEYEPVDPNNKAKGMRKCGTNTVRLIQFPEGKKGLLPRVIKKLLAARKQKKKQMEQTEDPFVYSVLDGQQNAYKVTANSLYGGLGAETNKICKKTLAACVTAGGRENIEKASEYCKACIIGSDVIYGDTDSVFVRFNLRRDDGTYPQTPRDKVARAIEIGKYVQQKIKDDKIYKEPHDLEYEKVFYPLMLITKKRYAGEKFEEDPEKSKFTSMGIVLKRRDNAPILKLIYQGVMNIIMKELNIHKSVEFVRQCCENMIANKYDINMFVISKTLRDYYKDPESVAHYQLALRMAERDAGTKPASNERVPYCFIKINEKGRDVKDILQSERIEHVDYIRQHGLQLDYMIYIEKQLIKPICQIYELVLEKMEGYKYRSNPAHFKNVYKKALIQFEGDTKKALKKMNEMKQKEVRELIFGPIISKLSNSKQGYKKTLMDYF